MSPLKSEDIFGNWATLLIPFNSDDTIDFVNLEEQIDQMIAMGVNGIYSNGTAGEFFNQTEDEFDHINALLASKCERSGMAFQIGCSHVNPVMCLERVKRAVTMAPGAIQVILPDWIPCDLQEAISFFERVAASAASVPLILYNPGHARKVLSAEEILQIKRSVNMIRGCKVAWKDDTWIKRVADASPDLAVFVPGHRLATGYTFGARGAYSNVACINPGAAQKWFESMKVSIDQALELEKRIQLFMERYIVPFIVNDNYSNTAADKFLAAVGGWSASTTKLRWPYKSIPQSEVAAARKHCMRILPEFFTGH